MTDAPFKVGDEVQVVQDVTYHGEPFPRPEVGHIAKVTRVDAETGQWVELDSDWLVDATCLTLTTPEPPTLQEIEAALTSIQESNIRLNQAKEV